VVGASAFVSAAALVAAVALRRRRNTALMALEDDVMAGANANDGANIAPADASNAL
jgi:hypothetical protein